MYIAMVHDVRIRPHPRAAIDEILDAYGRELLKHPDIADYFTTSDDLLKQQTRSMLVEAYRRAEQTPHEQSPLSFVYALDTESVEIGVEAADRVEHPAVPLMLAEILFDIALPLMAEDLRNVADPVRVAQSLHRAIWRRFPQGAIAYTSALRERLLTSSADARLAVARELHDRVGPEILVAIRAWEDHQSGGCILADDSSLTALRNALLDVQDIATNLRESLDGRSMSQAIEDFCSDYVGTPTVSLEVLGHEPLIRQEIAEEIFAITREAIRNARAHAVDASRIDVKCVWEPTACHVTVHDDGGGIRPVEPGPRTPWGLVGMRERSAVLGARFEVTSDSCGTAMSLSLPVDASSRG